MVKYIPNLEYKQFLYIHAAHPIRYVLVVTSIVEHWKVRQQKFSSALTLLEYLSGRLQLNRHTCVLSACSLLFSQHHTLLWHSNQFTGAHNNTHKHSRVNHTCRERCMCVCRAHTRASALACLQHFSLYSCMSMCTCFCADWCFPSNSCLSDCCHHSHTHTLSDDQAQSYLWDLKTGSATRVRITQAQFKHCCNDKHAAGQIINTLCRKHLLDGRARLSNLVINQDTEYRMPTLTKVLIFTCLMDALYLGVHSVLFA